MRDNLDHVLAHMGLPWPVIKERAAGGSVNPASYERALKSLEEDINNILQNIWNEQSKKAGAQVDFYLKALKNAGKKLDKLQAEIIANNIGHLMGKEMAQLAEDKGVTQKIITSYNMAGQATSKILSVPYALTIKDENAMAMLKKDMMFWVGNYYNQSLRDAVSTVVYAFSLSEGLGHWQTGQFIEDILGGKYPIPADYLPNSYVRAEAYWQGLATNVVTRATVLGRIEPMLQADVEEYEIIDAGDARVCPVCKAMSGKKFTIQHAVELRDKMLSAKDPVAIKEVHPWPEQKYAKDIKNADSKQLAAVGLALPDYHFFCRCDYVAVSFRQYNRPEPLPVEVEPEKPVPKNMGLPDSLDGLDYIPGASASLGGAGKKFVYSDSAGVQYIFKPSISKSGNVYEPFRAQAQKVAADLAAKIYDPGDYIPVNIVKALDGKLGTLQKLEKDVLGDLKSVSWKTFGGTSYQMKMIQQEHVLDWAIGNFDSHPGNFIALKDGRVLGVDKEQAFRFLKDPKSTKMSLDYHPNIVVGEQEPIYNTIYRAFANGEVDLDLNAVLPALQRLEKISDAEYTGMVKPYLDALVNSGQVSLSEYPGVMSKVLARKQNIREEFREFYSDLLKLTSGK